MLRTNITDNEVVSGLGENHEIVTIPVELLIAADMGPALHRKRLVRVGIKGERDGTITATVDVVKMPPEEDDCG